MKFPDYTVLALVVLAPLSLPIYYNIGILLIYVGLRLANNEK